MKAHTGNPGLQHQETLRNSSRIKEIFEMKIASQIESAKVSLRQGLQITVPAKLLGGLALSAVLMGATVLSFSPAYADEPESSLVREQVIHPEDDPFGTITGYKDARMRTSTQGGVLGAPLLSATVVDLEDDPFGTVTGYKDARMSS